MSKEERRKGERVKVKRRNYKIGNCFIILVVASLTKALGQHKADRFYHASRFATLSFEYNLSRTAFHYTKFLRIS